MDSTTRCDRGRTQDTASDAACGQTPPADSHQAATAYFAGSAPVISLKPLALARSTAAFTTAKIAP